MGDISEAAFKALTMFAVKLHNNQTTEFKFEQSFYGTKENLKEELFSIKIYLIDSVAPLNQALSMLMKILTNQEKKQIAF